MPHMFLVAAEIFGLFPETNDGYSTLPGYIMQSCKLLSIDNAKPTKRSVRMRQLRCVGF